MTLSKTKGSSSNRLHVFRRLSAPPARFESRRCGQSVGRPFLPTIRRVALVLSTARDTLFVDGSAAYSCAISKSDRCGHSVTSNFFQPTKCVGQNSMFNMRYPQIFLLLSLTSAFIVAGCGGIDSEILATGKCYRAGQHLNDRELLRASEIELERLAKKLAAESPNRLLVHGEFKRKVDEELQPQGTSTSTEHMLRTLRKWQSSSHCSTIRERALRVQ